VALMPLQAVLQSLSCVVDSVLYVQMQEVPLPPTPKLPPELEEELLLELDEEELDELDEEELDELDEEELDELELEELVWPPELLLELDEELLLELEEELDEGPPLELVEELLLTKKVRAFGHDTPRQHVFPNCSDVYNSCPCVCEIKAVGII